MSHQPTSQDRIGYSLRRQCVDDFHFRHLSQLSPGSRIGDVGVYQTAKRGDFNIYGTNPVGALMLQRRVVGGHKQVLVPKLRLGTPFLEDLLRKRRKNAKRRRASRALPSGAW